MRAKFHELAALILLSVAIFIHSSKLARMGTRFIGVTALPLTMTCSSSSSTMGMAPLLRRRPGVSGLEELGEPTFWRSLTLAPDLRGVLVAAARSWLIWASWAALRPWDRWAFSWASSLRGILSRVRGQHCAFLRICTSLHLLHRIFCGEHPLPPKRRNAAQLTLRAT